MAETIDAFYRGRVKVIQSRAGYRFAVDTPLLADFVETGPEDELCELGAGNGAVAVLLSLKPFRSLTTVEIQPALAALARRNAALNELGGRVEVVEADLRSWRPGRRFDVVLSNPPYIRNKTGPLSPSAEKTLAKHEIAGDVGDFLGSAAALLKPEGRAYFVYPARREGDFRRAAAGAGLFVRLIRRVLPRPGEPPHLFLARLERAPGPETELPPLAIHAAEGGFTAEAEAIFEGRPRGVGA
ncbi:MAG: methyltransferase [Candidatus Aminicenantes bacterium]|nr:methyltransferase [Candidatus Aminicenantes bacterium]